MRIFNYEVKLTIRKIEKPRLKTPEEQALRIFAEIEYYTSSGRRDALTYEVTPKVYDIIKRLAREDYLESFNEMDVKLMLEEELEEYNNPETSFYNFTIVEKNRKSIIFSV